MLIFLAVHIYTADRMWHNVYIPAYLLTISFFFHIFSIVSLYISTYTTFSWGNGEKRIKDTFRIENSQTLSLAPVCEAFLLQGKYWNFPSLPRIFFQTNFLMFFTHDIYKFSFYQLRKHLSCNAHCLLPFCLLSLHFLEAMSITRRGMHWDAHNFHSTFYFFNCNFRAWLKKANKNAFLKTKEMREVEFYELNGIRLGNMR